MIMVMWDRKISKCKQYDIDVNNDLLTYKFNNMKNYFFSDDETSHNKKKRFWQNPNFWNLATNILRFINEIMKFWYAN